MEWISIIPDRGSRPLMTTHLQQASPVGIKARKFRHGKANARRIADLRLVGISPLGTRQLARAPDHLSAQLTPKGSLRERLSNTFPSDRQVAIFSLRHHQEPPNDE